MDKTSFVSFVYVLWRQVHVCFAGYALSRVIHCIQSKKLFKYLDRYNKGIDRSFKLRGKSRLIRSVMTNWRLGNYFYFILKGSPSQDQQKTFRGRLITFKVTLTGQSHFMLIFWLHKVTLRGHINSVKWPPHTQATDPLPPEPKEGEHTLLRLWGQGA